MTNKRLIRFTRGKLAGEFRYVSARGGCTSGPDTASTTTAPTAATEATAVSETVGATNPDYLPCAERQAAADAAAAKRAADIAAGLAVPDPTFTPEDAERMREFKLTRPTDDPIYNVGKLAVQVQQIYGSLIALPLILVAAPFLPRTLQYPEPPILYMLPYFEESKPLSEPPFKTMLEVFP